MLQVRADDLHRAEYFPARAISRSVIRRVGGAADVSGRVVTRFAGSIVATTMRKTGDTSGEQRHRDYGQNEKYSSRYPGGLYF